MASIINIELSNPQLNISDFDIVLKINNKVVKVLRKNNKDKTAAVSLKNFMSQIIIDLEKNKRYRTAQNYRSTLRSIERFTRGINLEMSSIDETFTTSYEKYLKDNHITLNTVSFYMRILRAVYNKAAKMKIVENSRPFNAVYTGICKTRKRAVNTDVIRHLQCLEGLSHAEVFARDMFLFSFYTRGMSFVDMAYLEKTNLKKGYLVYKRRKTGVEIRIKWEKCMDDIVKKYSCETDRFMLPIITKRHDGRWDYHCRQNNINKCLRELSVRMGLQQPLTMYVARHSWASIALSLKIPMNIISQGLGHSSEKVTQIYIKNLDAGSVDIANMKVLKKINI